MKEPSQEPSREGLPRSRIDALVRLLADDDARIRGVAEVNLRAAGAEALSFIKQSAREAADPRVRIAANRFLRESRRQEALDRWTAFAAGPDCDLESGALLIAQSEYPDVDADSYRATLDEYADVLRRRIAALRSADVVIDRLNGLLFKDLGYRGNHQSYYDPRNSYVNIVMERKLGIPISLAAVYLFVARRVGQLVEGVGMPGRFILRYRSGRRSQFLDVFEQGRRWTHQDCVAHLTAEGYDFREEYLRAVEDRDILARMLANLLSIYHNRQDSHRTDRVTRMLATLSRK